jgi:hypothetical protein
MTTSKRTRKPKAAKPSSQVTAAPPSEVDFQDTIRRHAYHLFEQRGCIHGYDFEDWLRAEREILTGVTA